MQRGAEAAHPASFMGETAVVEIHSRVADSRLSAKQLGPVQLIGMRCGSVSIVQPGPRELPSRRSAATFILQREGRSNFSHYGHEIELGEGDFTLCDNAAPYRFECEGPSEVLMLRVPSPLVKEMLPKPDCFCGRRLGRETGLASLAAAMAMDLSDQPDDRLEGDCRDRAARHLLDVLASAYASIVEQEIGGSSMMAGRFWKVKLHIEQNLRDPTLSPSSIAERLRLSDRYLRTIFALSDETPSAFILRRRLEECARQLADPRWSGHSITDIAFRWGFNSAPHFARTFRERFATSPSDYRHQRLGIPRRGGRAEAGTAAAE